jgi:homoserine kinase type II
MSVFTHLHHDTIAALLAPLNLSLLEAIAATHGIENSNYLLRCQSASGAPVGRVLTVFEQRPASSLPWFARLLTQLEQHGLPVAAPIAVDGKMVLDIAGKKAFLVPWLSGEHVFDVSAPHCRAIGVLLARLHQCSLPEDSDDHRDNERQILAALATQLPALPTAEARAAEQVLQAWQLVDGPRCLVHADLFRDNVLFEKRSANNTDGAPSGLLDLYNACEDLPAYDVAVALNDWAVNPDGSFNNARRDALLAGYSSELAADATEQNLAELPLALTVAALRFYLSRRLSQQQAQQQPQATGIVSKDPAPFQRMFLLRYQGWAGR